MFTVSHDPYAQVKIVSIKDPAIDRDKSDLEAYAKTKDLSHLKFKDGEEPSFFVLGSIPYHLKNKIRDGGISYSTSVVAPEDSPASVHLNLNQMYAEAVKYALKDWTNVRDQNGNTVELELRKTGKYPNGDYRTEVSVKSLQILSNIGILNELGSYVIDINEIAEEERKNF